MKIKQNNKNTCLKQTNKTGGVNKEKINRKQITDLKTNNVNNYIKWKGIDS